MFSWKSFFIFSADFLILVCLWHKELLWERVQSIRSPPPMTKLATMAVAVLVLTLHRVASSAVPVNNPLRGSLSVMKSPFEVIFSGML